MEILRRVWIQQYYREDFVIRLRGRDSQPPGGQIIRSPYDIDAHDDHNIELLGPLPPDSAWQARDPDAFDISHFSIDWNNRQVTCPTRRQVQSLMP